MVLAEWDERIADERTPTVAHAACPTALRRILHPDIALAIWQRNPGDEIRAELASLVLDEVDDILFESGIGTLAPLLADTMDKAGYPDMLALRRDIVMLARQHAAIAGDRNVRIRLEVVETDSCRKFHADYVPVRTITTYLGQGTQWIAAGSAEAANTPDGPGIEQITTGSVAMFKGRLWQRIPTILHRSPPVGDSGEQRLVLVIDPAAVGNERAPAA